MFVAELVMEVNEPMIAACVLGVGAIAVCCATEFRNDGQLLTQKGMRLSICPYDDRQYRSARATAWIAAALGFASLIACAHRISQEM
jgi:hypothetical protein